MQTVNNNTPEQINAALFTLNSDFEKKIKALETKLSALETRVSALEPATTAETETE